MYKALFAVFFCPLLSLMPMGMAEQPSVEPDQKISLYPIVRCSFKPTVYETILMTKLRNVKTSTKLFRITTKKLADILVSKVVECLKTKQISIQTPLTSFTGITLDTKIDLVSILRSGDALLTPFMRHFPSARASKILIQRNEETALPSFKYMKLSSTINTGTTVVVLDPMLASGGTIDMTVSLLKERGVQEENIIIACIIAAGEGLQKLSKKYPSLRIVFIAFDENLNEKKYIVPGLGDFGDRYF